MPHLVASCNYSLPVSVGVNFKEPTKMYICQFEHFYYVQDALVCLQFTVLYGIGEYRIGEVLLCAHWFHCGQSSPLITSFRA